MEGVNSTDSLSLLSHLLLGVDGDKNSGLVRETIAGCGRQDLEELWKLATCHHVIMRTFPRLRRNIASDRTADAEWAEDALAKEEARICNALSFLSPICRALEDIGDVIVIKSLDHWPDLGNDLDLYTNAEGADVVAIMQARFNASVAKRSWGDRLAGKWNFTVPGLPELVEVHVGRLGQTGEQVALTRSLVSRAVPAQFGSHSFRVPAAEDRVVISTLQRMYRHFYLRLCDVADIAQRVESGAIDFVRLKSLAQSAGLWDGVATYLTIVDEYVQSYREAAFPLPVLVTRAARFGNDRICFRRKFLRVPIFPQGAGLYMSELQRLLLNGELQNTFRLSLLPCLAAAAALEWKITGNEGGIW
jgi:hypothetical protein